MENGYTVWNFAGDQHSTFACVLLADCLFQFGLHAVACLLSEAALDLTMQNGLKSKRH
jgi:hypothetical protein